MKVTIEDCYQISVGQLQHQRILDMNGIEDKGFALEAITKYDCPQYLTGWIRREAQQVSIYATDDTGRTILNSILVTTCQNFGGRRLWFKCVDCDRRVGKLYQPSLDELYLCRHCHNLTYESCVVRPKPVVPPPAILSPTIPAQCHGKLLAEAVARDARRDFLQQRKRLTKYNRTLLLG